MATIDDAFLIGQSLNPDDRLQLIFALVGNDTAHWLEAERTRFDRSASAVGRNSRPVKSKRSHGKTSGPISNVNWTAMIKVDVLPIAQLEFREGLHWYRERSMRAARRFALEVKAAIAAIREDPERFPRWDDVYRFSIVSKFPYYVVYREAEGRVVIVTIRHASREPRRLEGTLTVGADGVAAE